jgi:hypothetical protein
MENKIIQIYKEFANKWVALNDSKDRVLVWGHNLKDVETQLEKEQLVASEIRFILPMDKYIAPICH